MILYFMYVEKSRRQCQRRQNNTDSERQTYGVEEQKFVCELCKRQKAKTTIKYEYKELTRIRQ